MPWRILDFFMSPAQAAAAAQSGSWSVCALKDLGEGNLENVCNVFGYQTPRFILMASVMIFLLFLGSSLALVAQTTLLAQSLTRILEQASRLGKGEALAAKGLSSLGELMERERPTQRVWKRFERSLIVDSDAETVFSALPLEQGFSKRALIEDNVAHSFFSAIPGLLTGLGLLMTFIAILDGLSHVSVSSNLDVKGIGGLINGLSGKFVSSIVALTCTVLFVFVERLAYSRPSQPYQALAERLSGLIRHRSTESLLYELLQKKAR